MQVKCFRMQPFEEFSSFPLIEEEDRSILLQRECHFGGLFPFMISYYQEGKGRGCDPNLSLNRICELDEIEKERGENLAELLLTPADREQVEKSRESYRQLRALCEKGEADSMEKEFAELLLSERDFPQEEIAAILEKKEQAIVHLLALLKDPFFRDRSAPGYGDGPRFASYCLGELQVEESIPLLFELFLEETELDDPERYYFHPLRKMKAFSRAFLLAQMKREPISRTNERAAFLLEELGEDALIAQDALFLLQKVLSCKREPFLLSLIYLCGGLKEEHLQREFALLSDHVRLSPFLQKEIQGTASCFGVN